MVPRPRRQYALAFRARLGPELQKAAPTLVPPHFSSADIHAVGIYTHSNMSTSTIISADEFQALEQKVLRAVEIVKREREARAAAEAEVATLRAQLAAQLTTHSEEVGALQAQLATLNQEREAVRVRVEKVLNQIDELL